jgi:DNA-binding transcriptional LysR family regulator
MSPTIGLDHVSAFLRVVEQGSFTSAATTLSVPKSSVSRSVARLEEDLGVRLLVRTTRSLRLTDAGHLFYERARAALAALDEATAIVGDLGKAPRGRVRITAPVDFGAHVLAGVVTRFLRRHPEVRVEASLTSRRVDLVQERFDLALRFGKLEDSSLVARKIAVTGLGLWASAEYLSRRGRPRTVAELAGHDVVLFQSASGTDRWTLVGPRGEESVDVVGQLSADELTFVREAVAGGLGIGFIPAFLATSGGEPLVRVLPRHQRTGAPLHVVSPPVRFEPASVRLFREHLVEELSRMTW